MPVLMQQAESALVKEKLSTALRFWRGFERKLRLFTGGGEIISHKTSVLCDWGSRAFFVGLFNQPFEPKAKMYRPSLAFFLQALG